MPSEIVFPVGLIYRKVGPGSVLAEVLFYPEFTRLGANRTIVGSVARRNLTELVPRLPTEELIRRRRATAAREFPFTVLLEPPRANEAWRDPIELTFHAVAWDHQRPVVEPIPPGKRPHSRPEFVLARVVELGIDVIAGVSDDLTEVLRKETLSTLRRMSLSVSLRKLAGIQTTQAFEVEW